MSDKPVATFYGWMPNGVKTTLAIVLNETVEDFDRVLNYQNMFLSRGFVLEDPAFGKLEAGEKREKINGILRRKDQKNDDGSFSPTFDLYPDNPALGRRQVIINLDSMEEVAEFERITGYKVGDFKIYPAAQLNRKDDPTDYAEYSKPVRNNVSVVYKDNPNYEENPKDGKRKRQYLFVRWEAANATPQPTQPQQTAPAAIPQTAEPEPAKADEPRNARLNNEELVIRTIKKTGVVSGNKDATKNGFKYDGWGKIDDGGTKYDVRVWIFPEDIKKINDSGREWHEGSDNYLPVILDTSDRAMTRIDSVIPQDEPETERTWDQSAFDAVLAYCAQHGTTAKDALGVERGSQWKRGYKAAIATVDGYLSKQRLADIDFMGEMPKASGQ